MTIKHDSCANMPMCVKVRLILCDFLVEDTCYKLGAKLTQKRFYDTFTEEQLSSIKSSMIPLATVALTCRNSDAAQNFNGISLLEILKTCFNVGTEKQNITRHVQAYVH